MVARIALKVTRGSVRRKNSGRYMLDSTKALNSNDWASSSTLKDLLSSVDFSRSRTRGAKIDLERLSRRAKPAAVEMPVRIVAI